MRLLLSHLHLLLHLHGLLLHLLKLHSKLLSNIREIQARGAITIVIAEEGDDTVRPYADHMIEIPAVSTLFQPLLSTIPLQVFAASVALARGYDVDKPRNLAKSVTVE